MRAARLVLLAVVAQLAAKMWREPFVMYGRARLPLMVAPPSALPRPSAPAPEGPLAPNTRLADSLHRLFDGRLPGEAETVAFDAAGRLHLLLEGDVLVADVDAAAGEDARAQLELYAHTGGRVLGGQFDATGNLVYADAAQGLHMVEAGSRRVVKLTDRVSPDSPLQPGSPVLYADDVAIAASSGIVYFSDACSVPMARFPDGSYDTLGASRAEFFQGPTGRLLSYDPASGATRVLATGLWFANGVALSRGEDFVVVAATFSARLYRHWLAGPKAGMTEPFAEMSGMPDGVSPASDGGFWVAVCSPMSDMVRTAAQHRLLRLLFGWLPEALAPQHIPGGMVVKVSAEGEILELLQDPTGAHADFLTSATEHNGRLYLGSLALSYIGVVDL